MTTPSGAKGASVLSVCIPTWNAGPWIEETLRSLLAQEECTLDVVVCDDASTDATCERAHAAGDGRIRVVRNEERLGLAGNWNRAIGFAKGSLLCLFGQDDVAYPGWGRTLVGMLDRNPAAVMAFGRRDFLFDDEETRAALGSFFVEEYPRLLDEAYRRLGTHIEPGTLLREALRTDFGVNLLGEPSFVVVRRDHPAVRDGFDLRFRQLVDWEFYTRIFPTGPVVRTDDRVGAYRLHRSGASVAHAREAVGAAEHRLLLELVEARLGSTLGWWDRRRLRRARSR